MHLIGHLESMPFTCVSVIPSQTVNKTSAHQSKRVRNLRSACATACILRSARLYFEFHDVLAVPAATKQHTIHNIVLALLPWSECSLVDHHHYSTFCNQKAVKTSLAV